MKLKHCHKDRTFPTVTIKIIQNTELEKLSKLCIIKSPPKYWFFSIFYTVLLKKVFSVDNSQIFLPQNIIKCMQYWRNANHNKTSFLKSSYSNHSLWKFIRWIMISTTWWNGQKFLFKDFFHWVLKNWLPERLIPKLLYLLKNRKLPLF